MAVSLVATGITFPDASIQTTRAAQVPAFTNRIINGAVVIDQRNAGASVSMSSVVYPVDRWLAFEDTDGTMTAQRSTTAPAGFINSILITTTSADTSLAAAQYARLSQRIEGLNVADLNWGTASAQAVTVSFWVRSSLTGTFGGAITNNAFNRSYPFTYTISAANTFEFKTITIPGDTSGTWLTNNSIGIEVNFGLGVGSNFSGTAGAWAGAGYLTATGATSVVGTNGATFYITGVQLEKGSTATSFDYRPYGTELALCQRYFEFLSGGTVKAAGYGTTGSEGSRQYFGFAVTKRASPTLSFPAASAANCNLASNTAPNGFNITATVISTGSFGYDYGSGNILAAIEL